MKKNTLKLTAMLENKSKRHHGHHGAAHLNKSALESDKPEKTTEISEAIKNTKPT